MNERISANICRGTATWANEPVYTAYPTDTTGTPATALSRPISPNQPRFAKGARDGPHAPPLPARSGTFWRAPTPAPRNLPRKERLVHLFQGLPPHLRPRRSPDGTRGSARGGRRGYSDQRNRRARASGQGQYGLQTKGAGQKPALAKTGSSIRSGSSSECSASPAARRTG